MDQKQSKAAILVWLYHTDLWSEICSLLEPLKNNINIYLGLCISNNNKEIVSDAEDKFQNISFQYFENSGVDVRPFLHQIQMLDPSKEPIFFKIHGKKSNWGFKNHVNWRTVLLHSILGSVDIFEETRNKLNQNNIGMVCNKNLIFQNRENNNKKKIIYLNNLLALNTTSPNKSFCGGNIFASKTNLFKKYFNNNVLQIIDPLLNKEICKVTDDKPGGSFCHALERIFGYIIDNEKQEIYRQELAYIKIANSIANNGYFRLIVNYDGSCYIQEDLNVYGYIIQQQDNNLLIRWTHMDTITEQRYSKIEHNTYIKNN